VSGSRRARGSAAEKKRAPGSERLAGLHPIREALRARRRRLGALLLRAGTRHPGALELAAEARRAGLAVRELDGAAGERLAAPGLELEAGPLPELELENLLVALPERTGPRTLVALDGVEDPQNLGAIARVAEAAGVGGLVLTQRRAPPRSAAVSRASAGAIEWLPVCRVPNLSRALELLQREGFWTLGADAAASESLFDLPAPLAGADRVVVLGAEGHGLRQGVGRRIDRMLRIPLGGNVESLNVSTAAAVLLFELRRRSAEPG
jgi:23S rRNA (guanosine2251-2'-O)-methyltransferase